MRGAEDHGCYNLYPYNLLKGERCCCCGSMGRVQQPWFFYILHYFTVHVNPLDNGC